MSALAQDPLEIILIFKPTHFSQTITCFIKNELLCEVGAGDAFLIILEPYFDPLKIQCCKAYQTVARGHTRCSWTDSTDADLGIHDESPKLHKRPLNHKKWPKRRTAQKIYPSMYLCMYVCMYVCMCIYTYIYTCIYIHVYIYIHTRFCGRVVAYPWLFLRPCINNLFLLLHWMVTSRKQWMINVQFMHYHIHVCMAAKLAKRKIHLAFGIHPAFGSYAHVGPSVLGSRKLASPRIKQLYIGTSGR